MGFLNQGQTVGGAASLVERDGKCTARAFTILLRAMVERMPPGERQALRCLTLSLFEGGYVPETSEALKDELDRLLKLTGLGPEE